MDVTRSFDATLRKPVYTLSVEREEFDDLISRKRESIAGISPHGNYFQINYNGMHTDAAFTLGGNGVDEYFYGIGCPPPLTGDDSTISFDDAAKQNLDDLVATMKRTDLIPMKTRHEFEPLVGYVRLQLLD